MQNSQIEILYFYDALCGWCYGFSPVIQNFYQNHQHEWKFSVYSGGMMLGARLGPINEVAPYIKSAYKTVEEHCGVKFGQNFLQNVLLPGTAVLSSLEPGILMSVFKSFETGKEVEFAVQLQKAIYSDGILPTNMLDFVPYATKLGVDEKEFRYRLAQPSYHDIAYAEFRAVQQFGVKGFPCTVMLHNDQYTILANGYLPLSELERMAALVLNS